MKLDFNEIEIRIIGVLIEKQMTTPEYYPLTLNALINACNQKSNRSPVTNLSEEEVSRQLFNLQQKRMVQKVTLNNSRTPKYNHLFDDTFHPDILEKALLCMLFLRGPQTAGELRTRTARMYSSSSLEEVDKKLKNLAVRESGPFVRKLERQPGQKESRYAHLFCGQPVIPEVSTKEYTVLDAGPDVEAERIAELEKKVSSLTSELSELKQEVIRLAKLVEP